MTHVSEEIQSQPACWARAADVARSGEVHPLIGSAPGRVAFVGCGTSYYMAQSAAVLRESAGIGESDAFAASEFPTDRRYDLVVAITRSGTTTEVNELLAALPDTPTTVITTGLERPASQLADNTVDLGFADEESVVQTRFATTTLALLRAAFGGDLDQAVRDAEQVLARPLDPALVERTQVTYLGTGWGVGLAQEAALKAREAAQRWAESYPAMEFRHGPISVVDDRSIVWIFGDAPEGLVEQSEQTGALVVRSDLDPMAQLVDAQRLAVEWATAQGFDPDQPRALTRSVVLDS